MMREARLLGYGSFNRGNVIRRIIVDADPGADIRQGKIE
jgi:hypothetical protein